MINVQQGIAHPIFIYLTGQKKRLVTRKQCHCWPTLQGSREDLEGLSDLQSKSVQGFGALVMSVGVIKQRFGVLPHYLLQLCELWPLELEESNGGWPTL